MTRGQLPKAYLRLDPNIDQTHPDNLADFVRLLCAANRQPARGRFRHRGVLDALFGKTAVDRLFARGDLELQDDGALVVPGWEEWQEGDHTVSERMRRVRHRNTTVTPPSPSDVDGVTSPSPDRITPSEATRQQGNKAVDVSETGGDAREARPPTPRRIVLDWLKANGYREPVGWAHKTFDEMVAVLGPDVLIPILADGKASGIKFTTPLVQFAERSQSPRSANGGPKGHTRTAQEAIDAFNG